MEGCLDLNNRFSYSTAKYITIPDYRLGLLKIFVQLLIFLYVLLYGMLYKGEHLKSVVTFGTIRLQLQAPTKHCNPLHANCFDDFNARADLPYCEGYVSKEKAAKGDVKDVHSEGELVNKDRVLAEVEKNSVVSAEEHPAPHSIRSSEDWQHFSSPLDMDYLAKIRQKCVYKDGLDMGDKVYPHDQLFIVTHTRSIEQSALCREDGTPDCKRIWSFDSDEWQNTFVADAERFTVLFDSSFDTPDHMLSGVAGDFTGQVPRPCVGGTAAEISACVAGAPELMSIPPVGTGTSTEYPSLIGLPNGDVISVEDLLSMARPDGVGLMDRVIQSTGETLRESGGVLVVAVEYVNDEHFDPFGNARITYRISSSLLPLKEYKNMYVDYKSESKRTLHDDHGILIIAGADGLLRVFDVLFMLTYLSSSVVLMACSMTVVDFVMTNVMRLKKRYALAKYQQLQPLQDETEYQDHYEILQKCAENGQPPAGKKLLDLLIMTEKRLSRLDAMNLDLDEPSGSTKGRMLVQQPRAE